MKAEDASSESEQAFWEFDRVYGLPLTTAITAHPAKQLEFAARDR